MDIDVVVMEWSRIEFDSKDIERQSTEFDKGIYQIYGWHPSYGNDSLLYIGRSVDQLFSKRLKDRFGFVESAVIPKYVLLGRLVTSTKEDVKPDWDTSNISRMLCNVEKILIKAHPPALNQQENTGLLTKEITEKPLLIIHWGEFGKLLPETSTLRLSYRYWDFEKPLGQLPISH